jgi:transcriptional regulator with XRE-family HTH domain
MESKQNRSGDLISAWQCRAARAALGSSTRDFARLVGISADTLARVERGERVKFSTQSRIVKALDSAGFLIEPDTGIGAAIRAKNAD